MPSLTDVIGDKYRVDAIVGRGGMSVVYRATHLQMDQVVALKVLSPEALAVPEYVQRLKHEARTASRIKSEHVVRVFDVGELPNGAPYLVMEHLDGLDFSGVIAKHGPVSIELAILCVLQMCEALAEAHAHGIIHRDLKPANLFLTENVDGTPCVKILDFGISRARSELSPLTDPGVVLGTPSYMAPEQMEAGDAIDARSDIWALGALLYELLVGKAAYKGESLPQIFVKIMRSDAPCPSAHRRGVPPELDAIVARCMAIEPEDRFQSVAELARALAELGGERELESAQRTERVLERRRTSMPPLVKRRRRRANVRLAKTLLAAAAALAVGGVIGLAMLEPHAPAAEAAAAAVPLPR
jgi:serine/threonine-protein kinase